MTDLQTRLRQASGPSEPRRSWLAYGGLLLAVFIGAWLVVLVASDPARSGRVLIFVLGILVASLWAIRASVPILNSPDRGVAASGWAGLILASTVAVAAVPAAPANRATPATAAAQTGSIALKPAPPTAVRRQGTLVPVAAGSPARATPTRRPAATATPATAPNPLAPVAPPPVAPQPVAPESAAPELVDPERGNPEPDEPAAAGSDPNAIAPATAREPSAAPTSTAPPAGGAPSGTPPPTRSPRPASASRTPTPAPPADFDPSRFIGRGNAFECTAFASQAEAQAVLRADPTDPNVIDQNRDGLACETNPPPRDTRRVPRPAL